MGPVAVYWEAGVTCDKAAFPSERAARRGARKAASDHGEWFRAYACPECGKWHLTTKAEFIEHGARKRARIGRGRRPAPGQTLEELAEAMRVEKVGGAA